MNVHEAILENLKGRLIGKATGRTDDQILDNRPRNVLFGGLLLPRPDAAADGLESAEDFFARLAPSAMQLRFRVAGDPVEIEVRTRLHVYYRIAPPLEAQLKRTARDATGHPLPDRLIKAFRKCVPHLESAQFSVTGPSRRVVQLGTSVTSAVAACVEADPDALPLKENWVVPVEALHDEDGFRSWCRGDGHCQVPTFRVDLEVSTAQTDKPGVSEVTVVLVNRSAPHPEMDKAEYWDQALFDAGIEVTVSPGKIEPYRLADLPNSYRFDRSQWGIGVNCVAVVGSDPTQIMTASIPTYTQPTLVHRDIADANLSFAHVSDDAEGAVDRVARAMHRYRRNEWEAARRRLVATEGDGELLDEFSRDLADFETEIKEFEAGAALLRHPSREPLARAFELMNRAFAILHPEGSWRPFQLVFVVRNLSVLAAREWDDVVATDAVEVLWFPTGGGKTEAFLGLILTALFFDRLRGRDRGTTALIRLPLRLLSLQQFQRVVRAVTAADTIRAETLGGRPFTVGYWIGRGGSPNKVEPQDADAWTENPDLCQTFRKLRECPYCGSPVRMRFDRKLWVLFHHCSSDRCGHEGDLPLFVVDDELYRFLPSVVVGTVDKLAALGFQQRFANLLGAPSAYCPSHGFTPRKECLVPRCRSETREPELKDPVPALHIQDELHLLKEDLGAFDGHYETAVLRIQEEIPGGRPWKTIAATATIEQYEWQVEHLYCRPARRFPAPGPTWTDTFYARTDPRTSRVFVGLMPFNRSHINAMISVLWNYHSEVRNLLTLCRSDPGAVTRELRLPPNSEVDEVRRALRDYEISLTYVLTRKAGDQMAESLATQVAGYLRDEGQDPLAVRSLTGQSASEEIEDTLAAIQRSAMRSEEQAAEVEAITATSMISHGVDVDRFNFIAFFGMPRMTAEYIQASSRVARRHPGLVAIVFSPARERDRSHYHLFGKYHEYLERLVEPAAINRWARFALRFTVPGILLGYIINVLNRRHPDRKLYLEKQLHAALHGDRITTVEELVDAVQRMYRTDRSDSRFVRDELERQVELHLQGLRRNAARTVWKTIRPMMSLRDVEEPIPFTASRYSSDAFAIWMKRRSSAQGELGLSDNE